MTNPHSIEQLCAANLSLVKIHDQNKRPVKAPSFSTWHLPAIGGNPGGYSSSPGAFMGDGFNIALCHEPSRTVAVNINDLELAAIILGYVSGISLDDWMTNRLEVRSPRQNRLKLIFRLPESVNGQLRSFIREGVAVFEIRSGNCMDIVTGRHPEGGNYELVGDPASIPEAPAILIDFMLNWDNWLSRFETGLNDAFLAAGQSLKVADDSDTESDDVTKNAIISLIQSGVILKTEIVLQAMKLADKSRPVTQRCLEKYRGIIWQERQKIPSGKVYFLIE